MSVTLSPFDVIEHTPKYMEAKFADGNLVRCRAKSGCCCTCRRPDCIHIRSVQRAYPDPYRPEYWGNGSTPEWTVGHVSQPLLTSDDLARFIRFHDHQDRLTGRIVEAERQAAHLHALAIMSGTDEDWDRYCVAVDQAYGARMAKHDHFKTRW